MSQLLRQQSGNIQERVRNKRLLQQCTASALRHSVNRSCLKLFMVAELCQPGHLQSKAATQRQQQSALAKTTHNRQSEGLIPILGGLSNRQQPHTHTKQWQRNRKIQEQHWQQLTSSNFDPQPMTATMQHMQHRRSGNTNSRPTWAFTAHSNQECSTLQNNHHSNSQKHT